MSIPDLPDLSGRTLVVTGANTGIGRATTDELARHGARVVLACRSADKTRAVIDEIRASTGNERLEHLPLDLADLPSVQQAAATLLERGDPIEVLVANAGLAGQRGQTAQGFELAFGTNHLGHFLWTARLFPLLVASAPSRVVNLSSQGHLTSGLHLDDPNYEHREYDKWEAYGQAKTANICFTRELERRFGEHGLHAYAVHPGAVMTDLGRHLEKADLEALGKRMAERPPGGPSMAFKQVDTGAATQVWAATGEGIPGGSYLADVRVFDEALAPHATDDEVAARLWTLSEELVGEPFPSWA